MDFKLKFDGIEAYQGNVTTITYSLIASDGTYETTVNGRLPVDGLAYDGLTKQDATDYLTANLPDADLAEMQTRAANWIAGQYADKVEAKELPWLTEEVKADEPVAIAVSKLAEADVAVARSAIDAAVLAKTAPVEEAPAETPAPAKVGILASIKNFFTGK